MSRSWRIDAEFERRQRGHVADAFRCDLIHGDRAAAQVAAGGARDGGAGEEAAGLHVVAVAGVGRGVPEIAEDEHLVLVRCERCKWGHDRQRGVHTAIAGSLRRSTTY